MKRLRRRSGKEIRNNRIQFRSRPGNKVILVQVDGKPVKRIRDRRKTYEDVKEDEGS